MRAYRGATDMTKDHFDYIENSIISTEVYQTTFICHSTIVLINNKQFLQYQIIEMTKNEQKRQKYYFCC